MWKCLCTCTCICLCRWVQLRKLGYGYGYEFVHVYIHACVCVYVYVTHMHFTSMSPTTRAICTFFSTTRFKSRPSVSRVRQLAIMVLQWHGGLVAICCILRSYAHARDAHFRCRKNLSDHARFHHCVQQRSHWMHALPQDRLPLAISSQKGSSGNEPGGGCTPARDQGPEIDGSVNRC